MCVCVCVGAIVDADLVKPRFVKEHEEKQKREEREKAGQNLQVSLH